MSVKYNGNVKYSIEIDANNRLYSLTEGNTTHYYEYDSIGRLTRGWQEDANGNVTLAVENTYDEFGRSNGSTYALPDKTQTYGITYKEDSNLIGRYTTPGGTVSYSYDGFDRLTYKTNFNLYWYDYNYLTDTSGNTSNLVSEYIYYDPYFIEHNYKYTYDNLGNITSISKNGSVIYEYEYDSLGQLVLEEDVAAGYAYRYDYDTAGNITKKSRYIYYPGTKLQGYKDLYFYENVTLNTYTYGNSSWGDLLTNFNGTSITYDTIGNPLKWRNSSSMTWEGRQLSYQTLSNSDRLGYTYNSDGIRRRKAYLYSAYSAVKAHDYVLDGTKIIKETITDGLTGNNYTLYYFYDESGVAGFEYNGVNYYFVKNIQGDVIEICNWDNCSVVQYTYDAWGKVLSVTGSLASTIGQYNPFRYRGYYYDTETGFYYLNSRYYDPEVCRFINADGYVSTGQGILGNNMFAYCNNNPVMYIDKSGYCRQMWRDGKQGPCPGPDFCEDYIDPFDYYYEQQAEALVDSAACPGFFVLETVEFNGWKIRIDAARTGINDRHIHVDRDGKHYSQNFDGSPHHADNGSPPKKVREFIKEKFNWDWDKKAQDNKNKDDKSKHFENSVPVKDVVIAAGAVGALYLVIKWGVAVALAPSTGGGSLIVAGATP